MLEMMEADSIQSVLPPNRRERRFLVLASALIVFGAVLLIAMLWYLFPRGLYQPVASLDLFPPSDQPYFVDFNEARLIIVNTGKDLYVFDAHSTRPNCNHLVGWVSGWPMPVSLL